MIIIINDNNNNIYIIPRPVSLSPLTGITGRLALREFRRSLQSPQTWAVFEKESHCYVNGVISTIGGIYTLFQKDKS